MDALRFLRTAFLVLFLLSGASVGCSDDVDDARDLIDLETDPPQRRPIDTSRMGVNAFFNQSGFGTTPQQFLEIRDTLRLSHVRVLFAWTNGSQPTPGSPLDFGFFDSVVDSVPAGVDILVTVAHTPDWMLDPNNWIEGDPLRTWIERFLTPIVQRYGNDPRISSWQIFNEPDHLLVASDASLGLSDPARYVQLLASASDRVRGLDPGSLIVLAATRSIQQGGGANLDYNEVMFELGAERFVDIWAFHYYGEQFERVILNDGVADFLNRISRPLWITESGEMGLDNQLQYVETVWPFLREEIDGIDRIYYYRFAENLPRDITFGLKSPEDISNLYVFLRDRP